MTFADQLVSLGACSEAREWVGARDLATAWSECQRGDWMLWLAARAGVDRRVLVLACCDVAEPALVHVPPGEDRPRIAIETARAWCRGEATIGQVRAAGRAAQAAAYSAAAADDAAAADAYVADDDDAARRESLARSADIVHARITAEMVATAIGRTP